MLLREELMTNCCVHRPPPRPLLHGENFTLLDNGAKKLPPFTPPLTDLLIHYFGNSQVFENLGLVRLWALGSMYLPHCSETAWQSRMSSELGPRDSCSCPDSATYHLDLICRVSKNEASDAVPFDLTSTEI